MSRPPLQRAYTVNCTQYTVHADLTLHFAAAPRPSVSDADVDTESPVHIPGSPVSPRRGASSGPGQPRAARRWRRGAAPPRYSGSLRSPRSALGAYCSSRWRESSDSDSIYVVEESASKPPLFASALQLWDGYESRLTEGLVTERCNMYEAVLAILNCSIIYFILLSFFV